ncbi:DNA alkylation repair protein [Gulosibacter sp. 10]|uniref:DNA alkylation repair protein n=1 Tax=Gulosibacter sp. 10 TaxID=1255570 RepID=UPI00097F53F4|nr:DNA alkylation repair protein [Gulosibacter sp. 10]SJM71452.1 DNA alkylation repair enzyme [Gulosibacter sp. 10]
MAGFKDELSPELVARLARELAEASPSFDRAAFERLAVDGLDELELKARIGLIARALAASMPASPEEADRTIRAALDGGGLHGWASMPVDEYVATAMLDRPDLALPLLAALTPRYTAEFAIRPFIETHYEATMAHLRAWTADPDEHVRRLVSEGTRPRLPWGRRLARFIADPAPALALLEPLVEDDSAYVRRSVANHLNDIGKDHPDLALETAARWSGAGEHGAAVARHGLRTLVKQGHPAALAILGFDHDAPVELSDLVCSPATVPIGGETAIGFTLRAPEPTRAAIDYVVHYRGARGPKAGKVFKLAVRDLPAGRPVELSRRHAFAHVSIRRIHPGPHRIEIQVNGRVLGSAEIEVVDAEAPPASA